MANYVGGSGQLAGRLGERYDLGERLGGGAGGETYAAVDSHTGEKRALKLFRPDSAAAPAAVAEFRRLQALSHPHIVRVHDVGLAGDGSLYLVMDRVAGPGLTSIAALEDTALRRTAFERVAHELVDALAYLHGRAIVHADISPANVRLGEDGGAVLFDFGLALASSSAALAAAAAGSGGGARGTLGYAAPEALVGRCDPASDLFALGATLFAAWTGAAPFGTGVEAVPRMLSSRAPTLSSVRPGLSPGWDRLFGRLLEPHPEDRPASAREVLREVLRLTLGDAAPVELELRAPYPAGDPLAGIVVGRQVENEQLRLAVEQLAEGATSCSVVAVAGAPGSGRRTVIQRAMREITVARAASLLPPFTLWGGADLQDLTRFLGAAPNSASASASAPVDAAAAAAGGSEAAAEGGFAWLAEALDGHAAERPVCVVFEGEDPRVLAFATFLAGAEPSGRVLVVLPAPAAIARRFARTVSLGPLTADAVAELVHRAAGLAPPPAAVAALFQRSGGHAALTVALTRRLIEALRRGEAEDLQDSLEREPAPDLGALLRAGFGALGAEAKRLLAAAVLFREDGGAAGQGAEARSGAMEEARRAGWWTVPPGGGSGTVPSLLHVEVVLAALGDPALRELATRAVSALPPADLGRARALEALGETRAAAAALRDAARGAEPVVAAPLLSRARALAPDLLGTGDHVALLTGLGVLGRYDDALALVERLSEVPASPADTATLAERRAWLLGRRGDLGGARAVLEAALASVAGRAAGDGQGEAATGAEVAASDLLRTRLARLLISLGQLAAALEVVSPVVTAGMGHPGYAAAAEAALLAHAYAGDPDRARTLHRTLTPGPSIPAGRHAYLGALIEQLAGRSAAAVPLYRQALQRCGASHDVHTLATVALNLGGLLADQGLYGEALAAFERAIRELGRLGSTAELGTALVNGANLFVVLGELGSARRLLARARDEAARRGAPAIESFVVFVEADLERRRGQLGAAAVLYQKAASALRQQGQTAAARSALVCQIETLSQGGRPLDADRALTALLPESAGAAPATDDVELIRAQARMLLAGASSSETPERIAGDLARLAGLAAADGRRPVAWRAALCAARLQQRCNDRPAAQENLTRARHLFQEIQMATPQPYRLGLASDPDALWLGEAGAPAAADPAAAMRAATTENRLRRLLRINKRLNSELRLPRLLEMILDTVIELTDAERGFILLEDDSGTLAVRVARNIDQRSLETPELALSRSIARQAAAGGEPIVTIDAAGDDRFKEAVSVSDLHLRSVLAVPLVIKGRSAGTIYVDHRLRKGAFDQDDVNLVTDFAEQAAIALENARLLSQLRRRERQVEALNRRLEVELSARREELTGMKQELLQSREALAIRYDYRNIVGRTPRMLDLFRLLDRITDTTLPVVIQGESGTGKELVARALHFNGPRRDRPFVSESCAAIPETLLESTLFGYVRGAFTGADHDTRGLFEIADGGTLFLDEIGEMSPAMQGKLLRVLQEGEFRRVGGERTRKVDVRIVAATNRDLARMVEEGKFRQDLFFRLSVARIFLPPLRERREDIPLIVEHLLAKHGAGAPRKVLEPNALASLLGYRWPGNVRELENEIMRAVALSGERITLSDLSPAVAAFGDGTAPPPDDPDSLQLRPRVERLERSLLREALGRFDNNQTKAADALGLSRFGLQKKLKRYRFA